MSSPEKLLIAIISCKKYANRVKAQQETWIPQAITAGFDVQIFNARIIGIMPEKDCIAPTAKQM